MMTENHTPVQGARAGFTIVEVVMAVVLLGIILTTLGGLTFHTARQAVVADNTAARQAASLDMVNRVAAIPYAQLTAGTTCDSTGSVNNWYRRCATVTPAANGMQITVVTTPEQRGVPASSVTVMRSSPPAANPLCTLGC
jgi:prepilin-type N-terminal cleavage/methylation domain-containing protein